MDFKMFDADNHYYEAEDAFTRYGNESVRRFVTWVVEGKRRHLLFGDHRTSTVQNPTFNPVARPGAFHEALVGIERGFTPTGHMAYGGLEPLPDTYRDRDTRLMVMDEQGVERMLTFPSLGLTVEGIMANNPTLMYDTMHAFNEWLDDDWGFNYRDRIYAPPVIPMLEVERATAELEWALSRGARVISIRPGPAYGRSPADPYFDPFWARINEAEILVAYHATAGPSAYDEVFDHLWSRPYPTDPTYTQTLRSALNPLERPMIETLNALILGNLFGRFPKVRIASIEMGCSWVSYLLHALDHAGGLLARQVHAFGETLQERPSEIFKEKVWVSPFPEEDVVALTELIGSDHVLMGSDWPHPEGTPQPAAYRDCLTGLGEPAVRAIMRDNALALVAA